MPWSVVYCQYEGAGYGPQVKILVETESIETARRLIRENKPNIKDFTQHSVQDEYMWDASHPSFDYDIETDSDVEDILLDLFEPNYAVFEDGRVFWMKHADKVVKSN